VDLFLAELAEPPGNRAAPEIIDAELVLVESSAGLASRWIAHKCFYGYLATIVALSLVMVAEERLSDTVGKGVVATLGFFLVICMLMNGVGALLGFVGLCDSSDRKWRTFRAVAFNAFCPLSLVLLAALVVWPRMHESWSRSRAAHLRLATGVTATEDARLRTIYEVVPCDRQPWRTALYEERRYDDVEARLADLLAGPFDPMRSRELTYLYGTLSEIDDDVPIGQMESVLDDWVASRPDAHAAWLVRGKFRIRHAWKIRGGDYAHNVAKDAWPRFYAKIDESAADLIRAFELGSHDPNAAASMIEVTMVRPGYNRHVMEGWYAAALLACPLHVDARENKLFFLTPKWGGSFDEMLEFAEELRADGEQHPEIGFVVMGLWREIDRLNREREGPNIYARREVWDEIESVSRRYLERYPERIQMRYTLANYAFKAGRQDVAREQFEAIGDRWVEWNTWPSLRKYNAARAATMWYAAQSRFIARDFDEAERLAQLSVRLDPNSCTAHLVLARILAEGRHDVAAARKLVKQAAPLAKTDDERKGLQVARQMLGV